MSETFKILSLDGGGIRGVLSARLLQEVETILKDEKKQKLHEYFDLVAGTSTGSILAAGITCQMNAGEIIKVYMEHGKDIFLKSVRWQRKWRKISQLIGNNCLYPHKSGDKGLANVLEKVLRETPIGEKLNKECPTMAQIKQEVEQNTTSSLLILAYDVLSRNTTWFTCDDDKEWYYNNKLWEICTASSSAPTFFPPYELQYSGGILPHIDGGVSANNPELAAIAHALSMKRKDKPNPKIDQIAVLSIGTGRTTRPYTHDQINKWGALDWVMNIPNIFLDPSAGNSLFIAQLLFKGICNENHLRLDFDLNERFESDWQDGKVRKLLEKPYNKYIHQKNQQKKTISEEIDNPDNCDQLIEAAQCYLDYGKILNYPNQDDKVSVRDAIQKFIELH